MSIINMSFDTQKKQLYVSINGQEIDNVRQIYVSRYYDDENPMIEVVVRKEDKKDGVVVENRVYASDMNNVKNKSEGCEVIDIEKYSPKCFRYK